jgi:hypothetical protein
MSASKPARTGRDLARDFAILIREFSMHDLMLRAGRMLQEKLKFGAQPTSRLRRASAYYVSSGLGRGKV